METAVIEKVVMPHDRSDEYNKIHGTLIANNKMLDRFLRNKEELRKLGIEV